MDDDASAQLYPTALYRPDGTEKRPSSDPLPPVHSASVFHYSSAEGFAGMMESRSVYVSHAATMNDPMEGAYGWRIIRERFDTAPPSGSAGALDELRRMLHDDAAGSRSWESAPYVLSGTLLGDNLNQYRLYGMYQLELEGGTWGADLTPDHFGYDSAHSRGQWRPVLYGESAAGSYIDNALAYAVDIMDGVAPWDFSDEGLTAALALQVLALHIKHPAYEHEQEVRLVFTVPAHEDRAGASDHSLWHVHWVREHESGKGHLARVSPEGRARVSSSQVRAAHGRLVPYLRAWPDGNVDDGFLRSVVLGPTVQGGIAQQAVNMLHRNSFPNSRHRRGVEGLQVSDSDIRYRG